MDVYTGLFLVERIVPVDRRYNLVSEQRIQPVDKDFLDLFTGLQLRSEFCVLCL